MLNYNNKIMTAADADAKLEKDPFNSRKIAYVRVSLTFPFKLLFN